MDIKIITPKDLADFKSELISEIKDLLKASKVNNNSSWLRTREVCELLCLSPSGLQKLRNSGVLPYTQLSESGTLYYRLEDIEKILNKNMSKTIENDKS